MDPHDVLSQSAINWRTSRSDTFVSESLNPGESTRMIRRPSESKHSKAWTSLVHESRDWPTMVCWGPGPKILLINFNAISLKHLDPAEMMTNCAFPCTCRSHNTKNMFSGFVDPRSKINLRYDGIAIRFRSFNCKGRFSRYFSRTRWAWDVDRMSRVGMRWRTKRHRRFPRRGARLSQLTFYGVSRIVNVLDSEKTLLEFCDGDR